MEARCTRLLKQLKAYAGDSSYIQELDNCLLKNVAQTAGGEMATECYRVINLLKELETAAQSSKVMREQFKLKKKYPNLDARTDEDKNPETFQLPPLPSELRVERNASMEDKIAEPSQENPLPSELPVEKNANVEDKIAEPVQENPLPSEHPVEKNASMDEDKIAEPSQENPLPSELPVEKNASVEDKIAEPFQENPLPSEQHVELNITIYEDEEISESSQKKVRQLSESLVDTSEEFKTFRVLMDVSNFKPKELCVKIIGKHLVVHGEHEGVFDEHGKVSRKFTRKFDIPEDVDTETFRALLDCYKVLTIEASLKSMNEKDGDFDIPIYEEAGSKHILSTFKTLGPEFEELAKTHIEDGKFMRNFARKLAKQSPSDYIPIEQVL